MIGRRIFFKWRICIDGGSGAVEGSGSIGDLDWYEDQVPSEDLFQLEGLDWLEDLVWLKEQVWLKGLVQ